MRSASFSHPVQYIALIATSSPPAWHVLLLRTPYLQQVSENPLSQGDYCRQILPADRIPLISYSSSLISTYQALALQGLHGAFWRQADATKGGWIRDVGFSHHLRNAGKASRRTTYSYLSGTGVDLKICCGGAIAGGSHAGRWSRG
jgi:hypothetical protein